MRERYILIPEAERLRVSRGETREIRLFIRETMPEYFSGDVLYIRSDMMCSKSECICIRAVEVRQENLQDIVEYDGWRECGFDRLLDFKTYWSSIIGNGRKRNERKWAANPAVYVIRFERV